MGMNRDVMVNSAVTIVPRINGFVIPGQKDVEVCQFAVELKATKLPWPEKHLKLALQEQMHMLLQKMRAAGLVRD